MVLIQPLIKYQLIFILLAWLLCSCENTTFDKDKRQIAAKNAIHEKLPAAKNFEILRFQEDTLSSWTASTFKQPIRYSLSFVYTDSIGIVHNNTGRVLFTPD